MKTEIAEPSPRRRNTGNSSGSDGHFLGMKPSHWVIFVVICLALAVLVFETVVHVVDTTTSVARKIHMPSPVETVVAQKQNLDEVIGGAGSVEQSTTVQVTSQVNAQILELPIKVGDLINKGELLMRMDDRLIQAEIDANREYVDASKVKIKNETNQVQRYTVLEQKSMGTPLELEKAEISLAEAKQDLAKATLTLRQAELDLEHTKIFSPLVGIVLERLVNPSETAHRDELVLKLGSLNTVLFAAKLSEEKMHAIVLGMPAEATFPAFPSEVFHGKITKIDPNIDPVTRTFTAYVEIQNADLRVKPGLSGFLRIRRGLQDVLAVPSIAILNPSGEQPTIFIVGSDRLAHERKVKTAGVVNGMTVIASGLQSGEKVVTVGQMYLKENDKVRTTSKSIQ